MERPSRSYFLFDYACCDPRTEFWLHLFKLRFTVIARPIEFLIIGLNGSLLRKTWSHRKYAYHSGARMDEKQNETQSGTTKWYCSPSKGGHIKKKKNYNVNLSIPQFPSLMEPEAVIGGNHGVRKRCSAAITQYQILFCLNTISSEPPMRVLNFVSDYLTSNENVDETNGTIQARIGRSWNSELPEKRMETFL